MPSTFFGRMVIFVLILVGLRIFFRWNISIVGSVLLTVLLHYVFGYIDSRRGGREHD